MRRAISRLGCSLVVTALILAGAGCQSSDAPIEPSDLTSAGALRICSDATRPPMEYRGSDGVLRGFEVDLLKEIAVRLDLRPVWVATKRASLVAALVEAKCDAIASSLPVRFEDQKSIGEVEYLSVPIAMLVRDDEVPPLAIGLCGRPIGALADTRELALLAQYANACTRAGRPPIRAIAVESTSDALGRLRTGNIDVLLDELPLVAWYSRAQTDRFDDGGALPKERVDYAIGYRAGRTSIYWGIRGALAELYRDGIFVDLLRRWGLDRKGIEGLPLYS